MFAVVMKNIHNYFEIHEDGLKKHEAIKICSDLIDASHGEEAHAVSESTAKYLDGKSCTDRHEFVAFGFSGLPYHVS